MNILFITHYAAYLGANRSMVALLIELKARGLNLMVYCPEENTLTDVLKTHKINYKVFPFINWGYSYRSLKYWFFKFLWIKYIKNVFPNILENAKIFNPDIIHSNSSVVSLGWQLSELLKCKHVWHIREFGYSDYKIRFLLGYRYFLEKLNNASNLIFISDTIRNYFLEKLNPVPNERIYNGVFNGDLPLPEIREKKHFLILGMLHPSKGQIDALMAIKMLINDFPKVRLLIAGEGWKSYTNQLKSYIKSNNLESNVTLCGYVHNPDKLIHEAHALLVCSRNEAMGRVTAEAMAAKVPVIGYDGGATSEIINNSNGGLLYNQIDQLYECMKSILYSSQLVEKLGQNGYQFALENFTNQHYADKVMEVYKEVLDK